MRRAAIFLTLLFAFAGCSVEKKNEDVSVTVDTAEAREAAEQVGQETREAAAAVGEAAKEAAPVVEEAARDAAQATGTALQKAGQEIQEHAKPGDQP
jgi:hypothetical protein